MKYLSSLALLLLLQAAVAQDLAPATQQERLRTVSDAFSQCAAYYEVVHSSLVKSGRTDVAERAADLKGKADNLATIMAKEYYSAQYDDQQKIAEAAAQMSTQNYRAALSHLDAVAAQGKDKIAKVSADYQNGCSSAIYNPGAFSDGILATLDKKPASSDAEPKRQDSTANTH